MADSDLLSALLELHKQDPYQAVYFADYFGSHHANLVQYYAAWRIMEIQTMFQCCRYCRWAILPGEPHESCEKELAPICDLCSEPILRGDPHAGCDLILGREFDVFGDEVSDYAEPYGDYFESDFDDEYDPYEVTEDPLEGCADPTGGYIG